MPIVYSVVYSVYFHKLACLLIETKNYEFSFNCQVNLLRLCVLWTVCKNIFILYVNIYFNSFIRLKASNNLKFLCIKDLRFFIQGPVVRSPFSLSGG